MSKKEIADLLTNSDHTEFMVRTDCDTMTFGMTRITKKPCMELSKEMFE